MKALARGSTSAPRQSSRGLMVSSVVGVCCRVCGGCLLGVYVVVSVVVPAVGACCGCLRWMSMLGVCCACQR